MVREPKRRNERKTEDIARTHLKDDPHEGLIVEEQSSEHPRIRALLAKASKKGGTGFGKPEFLVTSPSRPGVVVVFECKPDPTQHESPNRDRAADYAVDGVLHYAGFLASEFDVIAVAVSGSTAQELVVSTFRYLKGASAAEPLVDSHGPVSTLRTFDEWADLVTYDPSVVDRERKKLLDASKTIHEYLYSRAKLTEEQKPLLVSGCLIALSDQEFRDGFHKTSAPRLPKKLYDTVEDVLREADLPEGKRRSMMQPYSFIITHPVLGAVEEGQANSPLHHVLSQIVADVWPYVSTYQDVDVLGHFYGEFLKYTAGDGKGLGIVLTPKHITELFADLAEVGPEDTVFDPCTGTGGFLIAAMVRMLKAAGADDDKRIRIKSTGLVGIEHMPHMFALAASNMLLRGDGKANLHAGSCFDPALKEVIEKAGTTESSAKHKRPTVGLINPPYAQEGQGLHELDFIDNMMDLLAPGSLGLAIVPMSCAIAPHPTKTRLLSKHTLVAAMSMPDELFHPVAAVTSILVFKAHAPHNPDRTTWFGYWKDDGFVKTKDRGRIDLNDRWAHTRKTWLDDFYSRREVAGRCVQAKVTATDEWCAEAYLETDYSQLTAASFVAELRRYAVFQMLNAEAHAIADGEA
jgi:type I restriction enzyme M protein